MDPIDNTKHGCGGAKYNAAVKSVDPKLIELWRNEQISITKNIIEKNDTNFSIKNIKHIAGLDISMSQKEEKKACASLVIMSFPELVSIYEDHRMVDVDQPYVPSFLAFK